MSLLQHTQDDKQSIMNLYGKTQKMVDEDIENIQNWMKKQPHLPEITDARVIERFLFLHKFRIQQTKEILDNYYSIRSLLPEFYDKTINDADVKKIMDVVYYIPLPKLTKGLHRVTIVKHTGNDIDIDDLEGTALVIQSLSAAEVRLREDYCSSDIFICDLRGLRVDYLLKFTPTMLKRAALITEKVFSTRLHGLHCINAPSFINPILSFIKSLLKPKLAKRIHVHSDMESLYQLIPKNVLPKDYGGEERSLAELNDLWKKKFFEYKDVFESNRNILVNEDLRLGKSLNVEFSGIEGNFRKLEVD